MKLEITGKNWKIYKHLEIKQCAAKQTDKKVDHRRNQKEIKNTSRQIKMETQRSKNLRDAAKAVLRGNFIAIQAHTRNKKNIK